MGFGGYNPLPLRLGGSSLEGWSPEQHARFSDVLAAIKRTAPLAIWTFNASSPPIVTFSAYSSQSSMNLADAPVALHLGIGATQFTLPAAMVDPYGISRSIKISKGSGSSESGDILIEITGPNVIVARMRSAAWNLVDGNGTIAVW